MGLQRLLTKGVTDLAIALWREWGEVRHTSAAIKPQPTGPKSPSPWQAPSAFPGAPAILRRSPRRSGFWFQSRKRDKPRPKTQNHAGEVKESRRPRDDLVVIAGEPPLLVEIVEHSSP
jgi:hypothetical protein